MTNVETEETEEAPWGKGPVKRKRYTRLRSVRFDEKTDDFLSQLKKPSEFVRMAVERWARECLSFNERELKKTEEEIKRLNGEVSAAAKSLGRQSPTELTLIELKTHPLLMGVEFKLKSLENLRKLRAELSEKVQFWRDAVG